MKAEKAISRVDKDTRHLIELQVARVYGQDNPLDTDSALATNIEILLSHYEHMGDEARATANWSLNNLRRQQDWRRKTKAMPWPLLSARVSA